MELPFFQMILGLVLAPVVAWLAYRAGSLDKSGAAAAGAMGATIFGLGGWRWAVLLMVFFVSSSLLSRLFAAQKQDLAETFDKSARRDAGQVLANGGLGMILVAAHFSFPDSLWPWLAYAGALAAVNADTWATEIGTLSLRSPRRITDLQPVPRGTSGGLTALGTFASFSGAALVGAFAGGLVQGLPWLLVTFVIGLGGLAGSLFDSLLGATVQVIYWDPLKEKETERTIFDDQGQPVKPLRGYAAINNDVVNFLAAIFGALTTLGLAYLVY
jgi:uncharacterized protein (TIGR00297 family)